MAKKRKVVEEVTPKKKEKLPKKKQPEEEEEEEEEEEVEEEESEENGTDNENGGSEVDDIRQLLEPFTKDQLIEILKGVAFRDAEVLEQIRERADKDLAHRKIFVRGLGKDTTSQALRSVFSKFGELEECTVIMDKGSNRTKGYGFVTFAHMDGAQRALKEPSKKIDGRTTVCQMASAGPAPANPPNEVTGRKIYVGNVPEDLSAERLLNFFSKFGEIEEGPFGYDKKSGKSKGFALFIYKTVEGAKRALVDPNKTVDGHALHCKPAASDGSGRQKNPKSGVSAPLDPTDLALTHGAGSILGSAANQSVLGNPLPYNQGAAPGFSQNFNAILASQKQSLAGLNPSVLTSLNPSLAAPLSQSLTQGSLGASGSYGVPPSLGAYGAQLGNPSSVLGVYGSQAAALQGFGAYPSSQLGQSTASRASQGSHSYLPY